MALTVDYRVDGDEFVVDSTYDPRGSLTVDVDYQTTVFPSGESQNYLTDEDTISFNTGSISRTSRFSLDVLGVNPGETVDLFVTTVYIRQTIQRRVPEQEQSTVEVTRPGSGGGPSAPSLSDLSMTCLGVSPSSPEPGDGIVITLDTQYEGSASFPTVRFRPTVDGIATGEVEERIGSSTRLSINTNIPTTLSPGDTVDVRVEAIDIEA